MSATAAQLLLAIAAQASLEAACEQLGIDRDEAKSALDAQRGRLADNERARRQNEQLLQMEREKVRKWESRLSELKTTREYAALARELDIAKKTNQTAEEEIRRLAGEYEEIKQALADLEKELADKEAVVASEGKQIEDEFAGVRESMEELEKERTAAIAHCDKSLVAKYERIRKQRGGIAVVPVEGMTCKGCQRNIPPQMANNLRSGGEILTCPNCNRFIYPAESESAAAGA